jgi:hypothetical protein
VRHLVGVGVDVSAPTTRGLAAMRRIAVIVSSQAYLR